MKNDILKSISQGSSGKKNSGNSRIEEIANELHRRSKLYEEKCGVGQTNACNTFTEQRITEQYALEKDLWLPISDVFGLGTPGPSGNENDTYVHNDIIYKVNNLLNSAINSFG